MPNTAGVDCVRWIGLPVVFKVGAWLGINCEGRLRQEICYLLAALLEQPTHPPPLLGSWSHQHSSARPSPGSPGHQKLQTQRVFTGTQKVLSTKYQKNVTRWIRYWRHLDFSSQSSDKTNQTHPTATYPHLKSRTIVNELSNQIVDRNLRIVALWCVLTWGQSHRDRILVHFNLRWSWDAESYVLRIVFMMILIKL